MSGAAGSKYVIIGDGVLVEKGKVMEKLEPLVKTESATRYIGFLRVGDTISCNSAGKKIVVKITDVLIDPDSNSVIIHANHGVDSEPVCKIALSLNDLNRWWNTINWTLDRSES